MKATPAGEGIGLALGSWKIQSLKIKVLILVNFTLNKKIELKFKSRMSIGR